MDIRGADPATQQREMIDRAMTGINTCLPGMIESFDSATQLATVLPCIQIKTVIDEVTAFMDMPICVNVPVLFPFASVAGFALTLPITAGDPCLLVFSQRCIDNWVKSGGSQPPESGVGVRHHDITDAFAIMAPAPMPSILGAWNSSGIEIRNRASSSKVTVENTSVKITVGTTVITVASDGTITMNAGTSMSITTPLLTLHGDLKVTGYVEDAVRKMSGDRGIYNTHTHSDPQGGSTGAPGQQE